MTAVLRPPRADGGEDFRRAGESEHGLGEDRRFGRQADDNRRIGPAVDGRVLFGHDDRHIEGRGDTDQPGGDLPRPGGRDGLVVGRAREARLRIDHDQDGIRAFDQWHLALVTNG